MNDEKVLTLTYSHLAIGVLYLILGLIFLIGHVPFYVIWTIFAHGALLLIFGALHHFLKNRIIAIVALVCFMAVFALSPILSAVGLFGIVAIILAAVTLVFMFINRSKKANETIVFDNGAETAAQAEAEKATQATETPAEEPTDLESGIVETTNAEIAEKEKEDNAVSEYPDLDPNDFEITLYDNGKTANSEDIKIVVSPYGVTLSEYSDTAFGDNEAHSYVLDEVNTAKFLECLKTPEKVRVDAVVRNFSGKDAVKRFTDFCKNNSIEFSSYKG
jgi:hypothetical protein